MNLKLVLLLLLFTDIVVASEAPLSADDPDAFFVPSPFEAQSGQVDCPVESQVDLADLAPVVELMQEGPEQAVACVRFLDEHFPGWTSVDSAQGLVGPFVSYMLGDGTTRGLQRHAIILDLLGPLQTIAPDWRRRDEVDERLSEVLLGSVVEDPFVANFWRETVQEADLNWKYSVAARSLVPELYDLAFEQAQRPAERRNERPKALLKELSRVQHARLVMMTRVLDSWPKRLFWIFILTLALVFLGRGFYRRWGR